MKIKFNGGMNQIGGNSVILSATNTCLLLDAGIAVTGETRLIPDSNQIDAILLSHAHMDHYGQLSELPANVPVYCGEITWRLIQSSVLFNGKSLLKHQVNFIRPFQEFSIGDFSITAYPADHSAPDAMAFLISDRRNRIFYTGDFRGSGRKTNCFKHLIDNPPEKIDVLIIEGTMLGRNDGKTLSERAVEKEMIESLNRYNNLPFFLIASPQNIDRMVSCYRAAIQSDRILVLDIYSAWILRLFKLVSPASKIPDLSWDKIKVIARGRTAGRHYGILKENPEFFGEFTREIYAPDNLLLLEDIAKEPCRYFIKTSYIEHIVEKCSFKEFGVIYSLWPGYIDGTPQFSALQASPNVHFEKIHAGGHASLNELRLLVQALKPAMTIPIHTEHAELLADFTDNVQMAAPGAEISL